jgi:hypothetical protein
MDLITREALEELSKKTDEREPISLVVELGRSPDPSLFNGMYSRQERLRALRNFYAGITRQLLGEVSREPGASLEELDALGQAVVTAPVATWRRLAKPGRLLADDPELRVLPNAFFHSI